MNRQQAVMEWIATTRQDAPALDDDADALLLHLLALSAQQQALEITRQQPGSIALFGQSRAAKAWLLEALCAGSDGQLPLAVGKKRLDYFNHINPGHHLTQMAIRFTSESRVTDERFPLRLRLLREAQLAQVFIAHFRQSGGGSTLDTTTFRSRMATLQTLRQTGITAAVTSEDVAGVVRFWQSQMPATEHNIDDSLWYQFAELMPSLDLNARSRGWSLLWGERQELTQQWQSLAQGLHLLEHKRDVYAPLSLLVDSFMLPAEGFLSPENACDTSVLVQLSGQQTITLSSTLLALLTLEVVLVCEESVLKGVDLIDIPSPSIIDAHPLWVSKCHWLIEGYRQQSEPDLLLVCHATAQRRAIPRIANMLTQWVDSTRPQLNGGLPGLVWAITPLDDRLARKTHLDEAVQQLVGKPGQRWGTLHAFDSNSLQRLIEWLSQATQPSARVHRLEALAIRQRLETETLLASVCSPTTLTPARTEAMIRALQAQAACHGELLEGLLPPLSHFDVIQDVPRSREARVNGLFRNEVDLFAAPDTPLLRQNVGHDAGTQAWRMWCQHLRHWSRQPANARRLGLSAETLQQLVTSLIAISNRHCLVDQLQVAATKHHAGAAQLRAIIGNFIAWLGYADSIETARPASRVAQGYSIFASLRPHTHERLTRLDASPVHAASRYVYDWLVALYTRAGECENQGDLLGISPQARLTLQNRLKGM